MPFTKFTNLDFDQIKDSIKDYLRANSDFTGFDFDGSNFSVLIDTLAYNTYITAFNSNMIVNESFLDSATVRENVVSLARNIGYVPKSRNSAKATVTFTVDVQDTETPTLTLKKGLVCIGQTNDSSYLFSIVDDIQSPTENVNGVRRAIFENIEISQGTFLTKTFRYDGSTSDQRFILNNPFIDTNKLKIYVKDSILEQGLGTEYKIAKDILNLDKSTKICFIQEVQDEKYELFFGDGIFGKKLEHDSIITAEYIITDGKDGNGPRVFSFSGTLVDSNDNVVSPNPISITTISPAQNGADIESVDSIKYYAPRIYSTQNRAVTAEDYSSIIKKIYPDADSVSVVGGEELDPPQYGNVQIAIKPKNGLFVSEFNKNKILSEIKKYSISGINQKIVDIKYLYVELDSYVYYDDNKISSAETLKTRILNSLNKYSESVEINKFGGRFKYSKLMQVIDKTDNSITSNITKIKIRRNLNVLLNQYTQYELCFGNRFHVKQSGFNIKSTGFTVPNQSSTVYFTDTPNKDLETGIISIVKKSGEDIVIVVKDVGTVDYVKGEINIGTLVINSTVLPDNIIEIQAFPESNDVVALRDLYLQLDISKSKINMIRDVISSGEEISGTVFSRDYFTSSYSNGNLTRD